MNQKLLSLLYTAVLFFPAANLPAQIDNLTNVSAEWVRSGARNASIDGTDIIIYNPGGAALLAKGLHVNIGNQSFFRKPSHEYDLGFGKKKLEQDGSDLFVPNLYVSYNNNNWAVFGAMYIAGGGATANYPDGSINTDLIALSTLDYYMGAYGSVKNQYLKGSSYYLSTAIGASYKVSNKFSFGLFIRNISAKNKTEAGFTLANSPVQYPDAPVLFKTRDNANGFGIVVGVDIQPSAKVNITARYESKVKLDFKTGIEKDDLGLAVNGEKNRRDLPATIGAGFAYTFSDKWKILYDFNYYFQTGADWGRTDSALGSLKLSEQAGNAVCNGLALEYTVTKKLLASAGFFISMNNYKNKPNYFTHFGAYETVMVSNTCINTGISYSISKKVKINAGFFYAFYPKNNNIQSLNAGGVDVTTNNRATAIGLGVDFLF